MVKETREGLHCSLEIPHLPAPQPLPYQDNWLGLSQMALLLKYDLPTLALVLAIVAIIVCVSPVSSRLFSMSTFARYI